VNIDGQTLSYANREQDDQGSGWCAANSLFWNCTAARINCYRPPGAQNWAYGSWAQYGGDGYWSETNSTIQPRSFYYAQLADRLGADAAKRGHILQIENEASSSPTVEQAAVLTAWSVKPRTQMTEWIDQAANAIPSPSIPAMPPRSINSTLNPHPLPQKPLPCRLPTAGSPAATRSSPAAAITNPGGWARFVLTSSPRPNRPSPDGCPAAPAPG